jgi:recombinational DNA repair ATPase RecF
MDKKKEYNGTNQYYKKNRQEYLKRMKQRRDNLTKEEIEKNKEYQKNYWINIRKKKLAEINNNIDPEKLEYYKRNGKRYYPPRKPNISLEKKKEYNKIDFN